MARLPSLVAIAALLAVGAHAYSIRANTNLVALQKPKTGLHEWSVEHVLDGTMLDKILAEKDRKATSSSPLSEIWGSDLAKALAEKYASKVEAADCGQPPIAGAGKTRKTSACFGAVLRKLSTAMVAGVTEPDKATCPDSFKGTSMSTQALWAPWGAVSPLGPCRSGVQPYHGSPPELVPVDQSLKHTRMAQKGEAAGRVGDAGKEVTVLAPAADATNHVLSLQPPLAAAIDSLQWRTNVLVRIVNLVAVAAMLEDPGLAAAKLGNAFHVLGDTFSASHVKRSDDAAAHPPTGASVNGGQLYTTTEACASAMSVVQPFSMDVVRWKKHAVGDFDYKATAKGARLFRCLQLFINDIVAQWLALRAKSVFHVFGVGSAGDARRGAVSLGDGLDQQLLRGGRARANAVKSPEGQQQQQQQQQPSDGSLAGGRPRANALPPRKRANAVSSRDDVLDAGADALPLEAQDGPFRFAKPSLEEVNTFVDGVLATLCKAIPLPEAVAGQPAGGADADWSSATSGHYRGPKGPALAMQPVGVVAEADFVELRRKWDIQLQVFRAAQVKPSLARQTPERYWLPARGWDACADGKRLRVTADEYAEWSRPDFAESVSGAGGYLLPPRKFMLDDIAASTLAKDKAGQLDSKSEIYIEADKLMSEHVQLIVRMSLLSAPDPTDKVVDADGAPIDMHGLE